MCARLQVPSIFRPIRRRHRLPQRLIGFTCTSAPVHALQAQHKSWRRPLHHRSAPGMDFRGAKPPWPRPPSSSPSSSQAGRPLVQQPSQDCVSVWRVRARACRKRKPQKSSEFGLCTSWGAGGGAGAQLASCSQRRREGGERFKAEAFRPADPQTAALASIRQNGSGRLSRVAVRDTWGLLEVFYTRATPQLSPDIRRLPAESRITPLMQIKSRKILN